MNYLWCLLFGFAAWVVAGVFLFVKGPGKRKIGMFVSFGCALVCQVLVVYGVRYEALTGDFAAIEDTIGALSLAGIVQAAGTLLLNALGLKK